MACPFCGKPSPCAHENARVAVLVDPELADDSEQRFALSLQRPASGIAAERAMEQAWRQEVASRVQQHRARRRRRGDSDASLSLAFPEDTAFLRTSAPAPAIVVRPEQPKIIQFPRSAPPLQHPPAPRPEDLELAAPVIESPRILYAPEAEQLDLLSSFADIELQAEEPRRSDAMDLPPQAAPLMPRLFSGMVDTSIVLGATILFAGIFLAFAGLPRQALLCGLLTGTFLWLLFQCVFLVYGQSTPGMRMAELELCTFSGEPVPLVPRAYRALASTLSAVSLGMGFAWALFDEDRLGWHDRMTQTHLRKQLADSN